jgi:predicted DNA-binding transcriptional regulator AlpA
MTDIDISPEGGNIQTGGSGATVASPATTTISLGNYGENAYLTKPEMCRAFNCSDRTLQRMVERFEIPPPMTLGGRKVWIAGKVRAWLADAAERREAEALKEARRLRAFE